MSLGPDHSTVFALFSDAYLETICYYFTKMMYRKRGSRERGSWKGPKNWPSHTAIIESISSSELPIPLQNAIRSAAIVLLPTSSSNPGLLAALLAILSKTA